jgi:hypothetical protein
VEAELDDYKARRAIAVADTYAEAEAIVDQLADDGFPVEHVLIAGRDLRYVERVTGHVNGWKAAAGGAVSGLLLGLLFGLLWALWFAHDGTSLLAVVLYWTAWGTAIGAGIALLGYVLSGGRRHFASVPGMEAGRYDVVVDEECADEAARRLSRFDRRVHPIG